MQHEIRNHTLKFQKFWFLYKISFSSSTFWRNHWQALNVQRTGSFVIFIPYPFYKCLQKTLVEDASWLSFVNVIWWLGCNMRKVVFWKTITIHLNIFLNKTANMKEKTEDATINSTLIKTVFPLIALFAEWTLQNASYVEEWLQQRKFCNNIITLELHFDK